MKLDIAITLVHPRKVNANVHGKKTAIYARYSCHEAAVAAYLGDVDHPEIDLRTQSATTDIVYLYGIRCHVECN